MHLFLEEMSDEDLEFMKNMVENVNFYFKQMKDCLNTTKAKLQSVGDTYALSTLNGNINSLTDLYNSVNDTLQSIIQDTKIKEDTPTENTETEITTDDDSELSSIISDFSTEEEEMKEELVEDFENIFPQTAYNPEVTVEPIQTITPLEVIEQPNDMANSGMSNELIGLIQNRYDSIQALNDFIANAESYGYNFMTDTIKSIQDVDQIQVGKLQGLLQSTSNSKLSEVGQEQVLNNLAETEYPKDDVVSDDDLRFMNMSNNYFTPNGGATLLDIL